MKKICKSISVMLCILFVLNIGVYAAPPCEDANGLANALYEFGLFNGTGVAEDGTPIYSLDKSSTRQEAVVMLVRLLGKENEANHCTTKHPFTDVDAWADKYVSYAYSQNIAKGVSSTLFGSNQSVNAQQYITFLLRALGYNDSKGDFSYENALAFSDSIGLTNGVYALSDVFLRRDMAWLSSGALLQDMKAGTPLIKELKKQGAITSEQYNNGLYVMAVADLSSDYCETDFNSDFFDIRTLYTVQGQAEYSGYQRLRGYPEDELFQIYFTDRNNVQLKYNVSENEYITYSIDGVSYKKTRGELHELFFDGVFINKLNSDTSTWLYNVFGDVYTDWAFYYYSGTSEAQQLVNKYLNIKEGIYYEEPRGGLFPEEYFGLFNFEEAWTEQELSADWIGTYELSELAGNRDLTFGIIAASLPDYSAGIGDLVYGFYLQGFSVKYLLCIYDMPKSFADMENGEATYSGIRFKKENGNWYFNPDDLIKVGLLNADGTLNEATLEEDDYYSYEDNNDYGSNDYEDNNNFGYDPSKVDKEFKNEWISSSELKSIYDFSSYWAGEEIWIYRTALFGSDDEDIKYTLTGSPSSKFEKNTTYKCKYKGHTIKVQYDGGFDGGLLFDYSDLCDAGIIDEL